MEKIKIDAMIYQDGADFYDYDGGAHYFKSTIHVKDMDLNAAIAARKEFVKWAKHKGLVIAFAK